MRSQFQSFSESKDYILTAFLLIVSFGLLFSRNSGGLDRLRSASITIYSYIELPLSKFRLHTQVLRRNKELRKQNIHLRNKLNRLRNAESDDNLVSKFHLSWADSSSLHPVQFVGKELHQANNVLTINAGSKEGLRKNMGVISAQGLVGKIVLVARNYSEVMPYLNTLSKVSAKLQKSHAYGIVGWNGPESTNNLELKYVTKSIPVDSGEVVYTSGYGRQFPPDIPIGTVKRSELIKGRGWQRIYIHPSVNLYTVTNGYVITGKPDTAKIKLQKQYRKLYK
jgi:rod shape-determining protein MreC